MLILVLFYNLIIISTGFSEDEMHDIIPENYTTSRPLNGKPSILSLMIIPHIVSDLSSMKMEFSLDLTFRAYWTDSQLRIQSEGLITLPQEMAKQLWYPWVRFPNCKGCHSEVFNPEHTAFKLNFKKVWVIERETFVFTCIFDLSHYPFDKQRCNVNITLGKVYLTRDMYLNMYPCTVKSKID